VPARHTAGPPSACDRSSPHAIAPLRRRPLFSACDRFHHGPAGPAPTGIRGAGTYTVTCSAPAPARSDGLELSPSPPRRGRSPPCGCARPRAGGRGRFADASKRSSASARCVKTLPALCPGTLRAHSPTAVCRQRLSQQRALGPALLERTAQPGPARIRQDGRSQVGPARSERAAGRTAAARAYLASPRTRTIPPAVRSMGSGGSHVADAFLTGALSDLHEFDMLRRECAPT